MSDVNTATGEIQKKKRRPHTRVSRACSYCRQQKTRCLRSNSSVSCLRCLSLNLNCSLITEAETVLATVNGSPNTIGSIFGNAPTGSLVPPSTQDPQELSNISTNAPARQLLHQTSPNPFGGSFVSGNLPSSSLHSNNAVTLGNTKLDSIQKDIKQIMSLLSNSQQNHKGKEDGLHGYGSLLPILNDPVNLTNVPTQYHLLSPINYLKHLTSRAAEEKEINQNEPVSLPLCIQQQLFPLHSFKSIYSDIISLKILTFTECFHLLDIFRDRYGRWLSFPSMKSTKKLLIRIRKRCPLLLTISCLLSLKYSDPSLKSKVFNKLKTIARYEINLLINSSSFGLEELQCLIILGAYSIGLSDSENDQLNDNESFLLLDGWKLSGLGLALFEKINSYGLLDQMYGNENEQLWAENTRQLNSEILAVFDKSVGNTFGVSDHIQFQLDPGIGGTDLNDGNANVLSNASANANASTNNDEDYEEDDDDDEDEDDGMEYDEFNLLTLHRIWNTFVLIHLVYCLVYGKKSFIDLNNLKPRDVSEIISATNFDFRITAEINICLIGYKYLILNEKLDVTFKNIKSWLNKWNVTFNQPSNQFVEIDYHFIEILIKVKQLKLELNLNSISMIKKTKISGNLKDLLDIKLHSQAIINLINSVDDDSYFAFLSDQIHLIVFYATNILITIISVLNSNSSVNTEMDYELFKKIKALVVRFRNVSTSKYDPFFKYFQILRHNYITKLSQNDIDDIY